MPNEEYKVWWQTGAPSGLEKKPRPTDSPTKRLIELVALQQVVKTAQAAGQLVEGQREMLAQQQRSQREQTLRAGQAARSAMQIAGTSPELLARVHEADLVQNEINAEQALAHNEAQHARYGPDRQLTTRYREAAWRIARLNRPGFVLRPSAFVLTCLLAGAIAFHALGQARLWVPLKVLLAVPVVMLVGAIAWGLAALAQAARVRLAARTGVRLRLELFELHEEIVRRGLDVEPRLLYPRQADAGWKAGRMVCDRQGVDLLLSFSAEQAESRTPDMAVG